VYTDRALNHMSSPFKKAMNDISDMLKEAYNAHKAVIIPGECPPEPLSATCFF
jgi:aspartate aminotransferase-like enzyme